jgi:acyl-CoA synthetase (AMP-forming)/AMP-acid ligase II
MRRVIPAFDAPTLFKWLERGQIVAPLTLDTAGHWEKLVTGPRSPLLDELAGPGLVFFTSGTTGEPKAILHSYENFLVMRRGPARRVLSFLAFDHIGGVNTLLRARRNGGEVVHPRFGKRDPISILKRCGERGVEVLPATPTFLRMIDPAWVPKCIKTITYSTERMDQQTLDRLCEALPWVEFRQTYGMSEFGPMKATGEARNSLWFKLEAETKVEDGTLRIRSPKRMVGYLNAPDPFNDGWFDTRDLAEERDGFLRILGRADEIINVAGIKVMPAEIERVAMLHPGVTQAKARGIENPLTGQHIEVVCDGAVEVEDLRAHFEQHLPQNIRPHRIVVGGLGMTSRGKQCATSS